MKHFFLRFASCALVGLGVFASCQQIHDVEDPLESVAQQMTIVASLDGTRTANSGNSTVWVTNDEISVIHGASTGDPAYAASKFTYSGENEFKGRVKNLAEVNDWFMVYPYRDDNVNAEEVHVTVGPQTQNGNDNTAHLAGENFPLYGRDFNVSETDGITIFMNNVLTRLNLKVENTTSSPIIVKSITFTGPVKFFGDFTGDLTQTPVVWTADQNASDEAVLTVANGAQIAANATATFYLGTMPFTVAPGGQAKAKVVAVHPSAPNTEIAFYHVFNFADGASFSAGKFNTFNLHFDETHQTDPGDPSNPDEPGELLPRNLEFAETELVWTLGQGYETGSVYDLPTLSGVTEGVTYSSSNEQVAAIVNGNKVRLVAEGMTTIKAKALANDTYDADEASLSLQVLPKQTEPSTTTTYTKVTSLTVGGTYLIMDVADRRLFTAATNGSYVNVTPTNGVINDPTNSYAGYEFTVTKSGDKYCLMHDGKYMIDDYSTTGNSSTGIVYESNKPTDQYLYDYSVHDNGVFEFSTTQRGGNAGEVLYFKTSSDLFKIGGSGVNVGVHLYLKTAEGTTQQTQSIAFAQSSLNWTMGTDCVQGGSYDMPALNGVKTAVSYSSDNEGVAAVSGGQIVVNGVGTAHITATAEATAAWTEATARLTVTINEASSSTTTTYTKATSLTVGGTYLITSVADDKLFKGATDGSYVSISPVNGVISDPTNSYEGYEFTVEQSGSNYYLKFNDGKYLVCDYGTTSGNSTTGLRYEATRSTVTYPYSFSINSAGGFEFNTTQMTTTTSTNQVLYYKTQAMGNSGTDRFKIGGSGVGIGVHLYLKTAEGTAQQPQTINFTSPNPVWVIGQGYAIGSSYDIPAVTGNHTPVSYSIEPSSVASIVNGRIRINGVGTATLTAEAAETDQYSGATARTTITIRNASEPTTSAYVLVTEDPGNWAGTYLFVEKTSETSGKAFAAFSNVSGYAVDVTINSDGTITSNSTVDTYALTVTDAGVAHANASGQEAYDVKNSAGNYVFYSSSTIQINSSNVRNNVSYYHAFKFFAAQGSTPAGVQVLSSGQSSGYNKYYLGYSSSAFGYAQSSDSRRVQLYKLSGDVTPTPGPGPDDPTPTTGTTYTKVSALTVGATYLITSVADDKLFKGATDGSYVTISPVNGVIEDPTNGYAGYEFTVEQSGSNYYLRFNDGKYLVCDYGTTYGNSTTGLRYEETRSTVTYPYSFSINSAGGFEFNTTQMTSTSSTNQVLYYKTQAMGNSGTDRFKIGGSGVGVGVHLYEKSSGASGKQTQTLYFTNGSVDWTLGSGYTVGQTYAPQSVNGAQTAVTYSIPDSYVAVAEMSNGRIKINGAGTAQVTATAAGNDNYFSATASYTLNILPESGVMVYSIENDNVAAYLDKVASTPYDPGRYNYTYVDQYYRATNARLDWPKPVPVSWTNPTSGNTTKTVVIYNDAAHTSQEMTVSVSSNTSTSVDVYSLRPGQTYYYVVNNGSNQIASGAFATTGRRRMIKVAESNQGQNYANNCRDLGGQVTKDGRTIKFDKIYRGSNMDQTSNDQKEYLRNYMQVGLDVDLRGSNSNSGPLGSNVSFSKQSYNSMADLTNTSKMSVTISDILKAVANNKRVYIHCQVGADRTGYVCMLLEALLGVPQERCDIDYEMTSFSAAVGYRPRTSDGQSNYYYSGTGAGRYTYNGESLTLKGVDFINHLDLADNFNDRVEQYVIQVLGISQSDVAAFRNAMLQ